MTLFRPEALAALHRWREVIIAGTVAAFGVWLIALGGWLLIPIGAALLAFAAVLARMAWRRVRFQQPGEAPGVVEVDEGQVGYMGPSFGGYVSLPDLAELRLLTLHGQRLWRLKQVDGQVLLIPVAATGAERLFDAFATLPDMDTQALLAALAPAPTTRTAALLPHGSVIGPVIWQRGARAVLT
jgi:hypothetical protein